MRVGERVDVTEEMLSGGDTACVDTRPSSAGARFKQEAPETGERVKAMATEEDSVTTREASLEDNALQPGPEAGQPSATGQEANARIESREPDIVHDSSVTGAQVGTSPGGGPKGSAPQPVKDESTWKLLADFVDEMLGLKNRPDKLLKLTNAVLILLVLAALYVYSTFPNRVGATVEGAPGLSALKISILPHDMIYNANVIARNPNSVPYLIIGFVILLGTLALLINYVASASIRAQANLKRD